MSTNNNYTKFVQKLLSEPSSNFDAYIDALKKLKANGCKIETLDTASQGMLAESGEFGEIVKKLKYQGKEYTDDVVYHLKRELGDVMFYVVSACIALDISLDEIIGMNVEKLEARYPGGKFNVYESEVRKESDI
ncbi:hypothetical protein RVBP17_1890 [Pseudomonas phage sp. 30-3]|nr:hypothetical protein GBBBJNDB_00120 [Pseudomonas phage Callisto]WPK38753.1 MazG-like pyrophosphatase [Pseudomonas phage Cassandra]WPK39274.1 MazG-like pyrophosphatase [Pseudomonas phage Deifobo]WPK39786.1 MazG-like pyrophosphatase [Pseudomonas phage Ettore]WPK40307.1 MazG-like pyrophosphatase [Pseudomonas phage Paride]VOH54244.1 hypothetical protein MIJ3_00120 [Pseudomonas phage vB_PaeM_MIJ3]BDR25768.1 hypothetical protein RVBP16_2080 [Pseudomonas phage sp. 30-2]BDR26146.1 hypothetical pr